MYFNIAFEINKFLKINNCLVDTCQTLHDSNKADNCSEVDSNDVVSLQPGQSNVEYPQDYKYEHCEVAGRSRSSELSFAKHGEVASEDKKHYCHHCCNRVHEHTEAKCASRYSEHRVLQHRRN